jgi:hypothetical protein
MQKKNKRKKNKDRKDTHGLGQQMPIRSGFQQIRTPSGIFTDLLSQVSYLSPTSNGILGNLRETIYCLLAGTPLGAGRWFLCAGLIRRDPARARYLTFRLRMTVRLPACTLGTGCKLSFLQRFLDMLDRPWNLRGCVRHSGISTKKQPTRRIPAIYCLSLPLKMPRLRTACSERTLQTM